MTKTDVNKIERQMLKNATKNIKAWASDAYFAGGVSAAKDSTMALEDLKNIGMVNKLTKLVSGIKLRKIIKALTSQSSTQDMFQDSSILNNLSKDVKKLA